MRYVYVYITKQSLFHSNINYIIDKNSNIPAMYNIKTVFSMHHIEVTYILFLTYIFVQTRTQGNRSSTLHFFLLIPLSLNLWNVSTTNMTYEYNEIERSTENNQDHSSYTSRRRKPNKYKAQRNPDDWPRSGKFSSL